MKIFDAKIQYNCVGSIPNHDLSTPQAIARYMESAYFEFPLQETFWVIGMNRKYKPTGRFLISTGTQTSCLVHPREVFKAAILNHATEFAVSHNHPSGDPSPSKADLEITRQLHEAGKIMGISLIDHLIMGEKELDPNGLGYYSFRHAGLLG